MILYDVSTIVCHLYTQSLPYSQNIPWCSTVTPQKSVVTPSGPVSGIAATDGGKQKAVMPPDAPWPWRDKEDLYVEFFNVGLLANWTIGDGQPMNTDTILHYANTWSDMGGGKIPRFVEAEGGKTPQIRVSFNSMSIVYPARPSLAALSRHHVHSCIHVHKTKLRTL